MDNLLLEMVAYLKTNNLCTNDGVDIFRDFLPDDPDDITILSEYAGLPPVKGVECVVRSVQVRTRSMNPDTARTKAWAIHKLFNASNEGTVKLNTNRWVIFNLRGTPARLGYDNRQRSEWYFNVGIVTYNDYN
jgi:hypothetical protein